MTRDLYNYDPSNIGSGVFAALFGLATLVTVIQFIRIYTKRTDRRVWINLPFIIGGLLEFIGYVSRIISTNNPDSLGAYIGLSACLLVSPALFAASIYMALRRVIMVMDAEEYSFIRIGFLTKIFVFGDVLSFLMQASGSGLMAKQEDGSGGLGKTIVIIGLCVQILFFSCFMIVTACFQYRIRQTPTIKGMCYRYLPSKSRNWQMVIVTLFACSILILIRCVVRTIEFTQGWEGNIRSHEVYLFVFDGGLMFMTMVIYASQDLGAFFHFFYQELISPRVMGKEGRELI